MTALNTSTPVLILGGGDNSVSVCRHLGRHGIPVRVSGDPSSCWGLYSRYCLQQIFIPKDVEAQDFWTKLLLSGDDRSLDGHALLPCNDESVEFLSRHRDALLKRYLLPEFVPELQLAMLNKRQTLELARSVGVPIPQFWDIRTAEDVKKIRDEIRFPVMVKPIHSHLFQRVFNKKLFIIDSSFEELLAKATMALERGVEIMVLEMIPGPDTLLCSQFSYIDNNGKELYNYTKRVIRRYPVNSGPTSYHITEWIPEVNELARRLLMGINFRGLANPEFKRDVRDGKLKLIEVNVRFTAVHELLVRSGLPLDLIVYCHLTKQPLPTFGSYAQFMRMWKPLKDFLAYRQLSRKGELTLASWLASVLLHRKFTPIFQFTDPRPSLASLAIMTRRRLAKLSRA